MDLHRARAVHAPHRGSGGPGHSASPSHPPGGTGTPEHSAVPSAHSSQCRHASKQSGASSPRAQQMTFPGSPQAQCPSTQIVPGTYWSSDWQ
ncbi:hypothetical protein WME94_46060 [Sorangium sp. So ce429]